MSDIEISIPATDLEDGAGVVIEGGGREVLVVQAGGTVYAVENRCPHGGAAMDKGKIAHGRIECPLHGAIFRLSDGGIERQPSPRALRCYPCRTEEGRVVVALPGEEQAERAIPGSKPAGGATSSCLSPP